MKTLNIGATLLFSLFAISFSFAQNTVKKETLKVWGNCGMCKKVIEKSAKTAGATAAIWDEDSKELKVTYASNKTNSTKIQQAIAKSGYDTQDFFGDDAAYEKLPGCCHYDRKSKSADASPVAKKCCDHEGCGTVKDACKGMSCCKDKDCCSKKDGMAKMNCDKEKGACKKSCCKS
ncbi:MAG: hypothetical protein IPP31_09280 [Chitinophagaceae bacterium]|nr:hypothetical protein [Chitinophagaceae bacterium]